MWDTCSANLGISITTDTTDETPLWQAFGRTTENFSAIFTVWSTVKSLGIRATGKYGKTKNLPVFPNKEKMVL